MKPGYQTSEFGVVAATLAGIFVTTGWVNASDADAVARFLESLFAFLSAAAIAIAYLQHRTALKIEDTKYETKSDIESPIDDASTASASI